MNNPRQGNFHSEPHPGSRSAGDPPAFDQAMRQRYVESLSRVPSGTCARLRAARHAVAIRASARVGARWKWASAVAAVFAVTLGLTFSSAPPSNETAPAASGIAVTDTLYDADRAVAVLDENPDMYLWLAANDDALHPVTEQ